MGSFSISNKKLRKKTEYDAVFAMRKTVDSRLFKIFWGRNTCDTPRIGISVTKRNFAKAVSRNKLKRLVKESFRLNSESLPLVDIVLVVKKEAALQTAGAFFVELDKKWQQLTKTVKEQS